MKEAIRKNAKKYFEEELSGEPLYQDLVIDWLTEFAEQQVKLFAIPDVSKCNEGKLTKCRNCGDMVEMVSTGEMCPHCFR